MNPLEPTDDALDPAVAHAMQLWLWRALMTQLIRQKVVQPWDIFEWFGVAGGKITDPLEAQGYELARTMFFKRYVEGTDPRPYSEQDKPHPQPDVAGRPGA